MGKRNGCIYGDSVEVELHIDADDEDIYFVIDNLIAGDPKEVSEQNQEYEPCVEQMIAPRQQMDGSVACSLVAVPRG